MQIDLANGDRGSIYIFTTNSGNSSFSANLRLTHERYDISVTLNRAKSKIERACIGEKRFKTPALLDAAVSRIIKMILEHDHPVTSEELPLGLGQFDAHHHILNGVSIPQRHQHLIGLLLVKPYEKTHKASKKLAEKNSSADLAAARATEIAQNLPDGCVVGQVDTLTSEAYANRTKLALVQTIRSTASRSRRVLSALAGFDVPRPLTAKQLIRFDQIESPNALSIVHDMHLQKERRDVIEAAFRLSFRLEPAGRNPLLDSPADISVSASKLEGFQKRVTFHRAAFDIELKAIALSQSNLDHGYVSHLVTGCGFMALRIGDRVEHHLRPAIIRDPSLRPAETDLGMQTTKSIVCIPASHRREIEAGIRERFNNRLGEADRLLEELDCAWSHLKEHYPEI